jgi:hypothetical protein
MISNADDLEFRLHLRNEIMRAGLIDVLEVNAVEQYEYISVLFNMLECIKWSKIGSYSCW